MNPVSSDTVFLPGIIYALMPCHFNVIRLFQKIKEAVDFIRRKEPDTFADRHSGRNSDLAARIAFDDFPIHCRVKNG